MNPLFAFDNAFANSIGSYPLEAQCEMLADIGYDAIYVSPDLDGEGWERIERLGTVPGEYGLDVAGVYEGTDVTGDGSKARRLLETVEGGTNVELALHQEPLEPSDPAGDDAAVALLEDLLELAADRDLTLTLYPHFGNWLERVEDAVRLCERIEHPNLGVAFCGYHWYRVDGERPRDRIEAAAPHLTSVNLSGSRSEGIGPLSPSIEPLDRGECDNFALIAALDDVEYEGPIGVQCYGIGGDPYMHLKRSHDAYRNMQDRLREHPDWGCIEWAED